MKTSIKLLHVRRAATARARNEEKYRRAIFLAHEEGHSYREIAEAAEISRARAQQIVNEERRREKS